MKWIPREQNVEADYLSKIKDFDNSINDHVFRYLNYKWIPIQLTDLPVITMLNLIDLTQGITNLVQRQLMPF